MCYIDYNHLIMYRKLGIFVLIASIIVGISAYDYTQNLKSLFESGPVKEIKVLTDKTELIDASPTKEEYAAKKELKIHTSPQHGAVNISALKERKIIEYKTFEGYEGEDSFTYGFTNDQNEVNKIDIVTVKIEALTPSDEDNDGMDDIYEEDDLNKDGKKDRKQNNVLAYKNAYIQLDETCNISDPSASILPDNVFTSFANVFQFSTDCEEGAVIFDPGVPKTAKNVRMKSFGSFNGKEKKWDFPKSAKIRKSEARTDRGTVVYEFQLKEADFTPSGLEGAGEYAISMGTLSNEQEDTLDFAYYVNL
jgi:hypothetical protein